MRLTLDQLEAERGEFEPFEVDLGDGQVINLPHPKDITFATIVGFDNARPDTVLRALMGDEAFESFTAEPRITLRVLEQILSAYYAHFGLGSPGEGVASQPSSIVSARQSRRTSRGSKSA